MLAKKTIVHITYKISAGGLEQVLLQTVNGLPQYNHVVIAISTSDDFMQRFDSTTQFINLDKKAGGSAKVLWAAFKLLRQLKPDVVHTYNLAGAEFLPVAFFAGVKKRVHSEHGTPQTQAALRSNKITWLRKAFLPFANHIIVVSKQLKEWLVDIIGQANDKVSIILNGVNTSVYSLHGRRNTQSFTLGTVARLSPEKNQALLIQAFAEFLLRLPQAQASNCFLRIVGDGPQMLALVDLVKQLNLTNQVVFVGNSNTVSQELELIDLFILTSISEGMPMTILEAMATGLPILSTDVGNIRGVVEASKGGMVVPSENKDKLVEALLWFYSQESERLEMGNNAHAYVQDNCSDTNMLLAYQSIYDAK